MTSAAAVHYARRMSAVVRNDRFALCVGGALLGLCSSVAAMADEDPLAAARELFAAAYATVDAGIPLPMASDSPELRDYILYPYLQRERIEHALANDSDVAGADAGTRAFLQAHAGEPVARELEHAWLASLARRHEWRTFIEEYRPAADPVLRCEWLNARIALGATGGLAADVAKEWLTPQRLPPNCEPTFEWLAQQGRLTDDLIERRVRLLLDNGQAGFARVIAARLPSDRAAPLLQWADLLEHPEAAFDALLTDPRRLLGTDDVALLAGWRGFTRNDPAAALERYDALRSVLGKRSARASKYALALALGLAWDRRAQDAERAFADVAAADLDDYALSWLARAALWTGDWRLVERAIAAMSTEQRGESRWTYWQARATAARGDDSGARELYAALLPRDNFYSANAAARLGLLAKPHPEALEVDRDALETIAARPAFVRARELLLSGLRSAAVSEWLAGCAALDDADRTQAVHLAASWQWHDISVATATRQNVFFDYALLYPRPYDTEVRSAARLTQIEPPLIYGVIRQESLFRPDAVSAAGAVGLAQLRPETARLVARDWSQPRPGAAQLLEPAVNITLGASHLRDLINEFDEQTPVALAGYNAGDNAVERWLPEQSTDADVWIENIPFNETRDYVQRVLWHSVVFGWLQSGEGQNVESWLAPVTPRRVAQSADRAPAAAQTG